MPKFKVVSGRAIQAILATRERETIALVEQTYLAHAAGETINPDSYFLRFPDRPDARIIALPAHIDSTPRVSGIKWIASFPSNHDRALPRASAVLILNDADTGMPFACLEGSTISAARTAASAAAGAARLHPGGPGRARLGIVGAGIIAEQVVAYLVESGWTLDAIGITDLRRDQADRLAASLIATLPDAAITIGPVEETLSSADLILFTTTAGTPHLHDAALFAHAPTVLHLSLRDLSPEVILAGQSIVDDVEHSMKADTSVHLTEQKVGHRGFVDGTLADVIEGRVIPRADVARIFSPFGLGVLDLAVGHAVYDAACRDGAADEVPDFFPAWQ